MRARGTRGRATTSLSVWLRLLRARNLILREIRRSMSDQGTTLPRFEVLARLERSPGGLTPRELATQLLVTAGNLTVIVRQLEKEGLVAREAVKEDRRSYRLALTAAGRRRIARLIPRHRRDVERILSPVPGETLEQLRAALGETLENLGSPEGRATSGGPTGDDRAQPTA